MKKIFIFGTVFLLIYLVLKPNDKPILALKDADIEEAQLITNSVISAETPISASQTQNATNYTADSINYVEAKKETKQEMTENIKEVEFRQIEEGDGTYAPTPKILTGMSAKIFSLYYTTDFLSSFKPQVEVKDIQSAFANGIYPTLKIIKALQLEGPFSGHIRTDMGVTEVRLNWNLKIDNNIDPVQGIFSFKVDGVEKSCDAKISGPLRNISLLAGDNGAFLIMSCDKSFYMQLYRSNSESMNGSYFEKQANGKYKSRDYVMLKRGTVY